MAVDPQTPPVEQLEPQAAEAPAYRWYHKTAALLLVVFCLEVGVVLLVFPWSGYWDNNFFSTWIPKFHNLWANPYFRGAVSGLGVANIGIAVLELNGLRRFSKSG